MKSSPVTDNSRQQSITPLRWIFLVDGLGALLTAILTGLVLPAFTEYIGMPVTNLYTLALLAAGFAVYSFACHFFLRRGHAPFLKLIMIANLFYCLLTIVLIFGNLADLRALGLAYFIGEILLVIGLVFLEFKTLQTMMAKN